jgi:hypothetical protein
VDRGGTDGDKGAKDVRFEEVGWPTRVKGGSVTEGRRE